MHTLQSWVNGKISRNRRRLRADARATEEWNRFTGKPNYAKVTLAAYPADQFSLVSAPDAWRSEAERESYERYVLDGVLSELVCGSHEPVLGINVIVESTVTHEVESNGYSFFNAAKLATAKLLCDESGQRNGNVMLVVTDVA